MKKLIKNVRNFVMRPCSGCGRPMGPGETCPNCGSQTVKH